MCYLVFKVQLDHEPRAKYMVIGSIMEALNLNVIF